MEKPFTTSMRFTTMANVFKNILIPSDNIELCIGAFKPAQNHTFIEMCSHSANYGGIRFEIDLYCYAKRKKNQLAKTLPNIQFDHFSTFHHTKEP